MPPGTQIKLVKLSDGSYQAQESTMGVPVQTTFRLQPDGSYQAAAVIPSEVARLLPTGFADKGIVSFWVGGDILFGDTVENVTGPNTLLKAQRTWKAKRVAT